MRADGEVLADYAELVRRWAGKLDLVAPADLERFEERHIADCIRLAPILDELPPGLCADLGSGAGLPGVPLAIARPARHWRLIEPRRRRAAFLEEVVRTLGLDCEVVVATAAQAAGENRLARAHILVTARALAPPTSAFSALMPLVSSDGVGAVWVGAATSRPPESKEWAPGIAIIRGEAVPSDS